MSSTYGPAGGFGSARAGYGRAARPQRLGVVPPSDPTRLARWAQLGLLAAASTYGVALPLNLWALLALDDWALHASDGVALAAGLVTVVVAIVMMSWTAQVHRNARRLTGDMDRKDWWGWGGWIIPFANLVVPYRAIAQVHRRHRQGPRSGSAAERLPATFPWWWGLWLAGGTAGNAVDRVGDLNVLLWIRVVEAALLIGAGILGAAVVRAVTDRQLVAIDLASGALQPAMTSAPPTPPPGGYWSSAIAAAPPPPPGDFPPPVLPPPPPPRDDVGGD